MKIAGVLSPGWRLLPIPKSPLRPLGRRRRHLDGDADGGQRQLGAGAGSGHEAREKDTVTVAWGSVTTIRICILCSLVGFTRSHHWKCSWFVLGSRPGTKRKKTTIMGVHITTMVYLRLVLQIGSQGHSLIGG